MDVEMKAEEFTSDAPIWDIKTEGDIVPIISGEEENIQTATLACFLEKGTIPQLPEVGVDWASFLTKDRTFGELDAEIRQSLRNADRIDYQPNYEINGDRLTLAVSKEIKNEL